jgi:undecaprenyl-diphosphatase
MDFFQAAFLGIMQGIFEWLPVSSQGNVASLAVAFFGISAEEAVRYAIFLHIGTLFAAAFYFRNELQGMLRGKERKLRNFMLIAVAATAITALPAYLFLKAVSGSAFALMALTGAMLFVTGFLQKAGRKVKETALSGKNSVLLGLAQGFSVLPGISRSGITTAALLFEGFTPERAFRVSFLLSVPSVLLGELAFSLFEGFALDIYAVTALLFACAFGLLSIGLLIRLAGKINFSLFCFGFGTFYLLLAAVQAGIV